MSGTERVFPPKAPGTPPSGGGGGGVKMPQVNQKTAMAGGAVLVALIALYSARRGGSAEVDGVNGEEYANVATRGGYVLDTRDTDIYNELQPELEQIVDRLDALDLSKAPVPPPVRPNPTGPRPVPPAPKPQKGTPHPQHKPKKPKKKPTPKAGRKPKRKPRRPRG